MRAMRSAVMVALLAGLASAQEVHLTMRGPEPPLVAPGATATIELDVLGADDANLVGALPVLDGLTVLAAPREALPTGRGCRLRLALTPQRTGSFALPPFAVTARGQTLSSRNATLECATNLQGGDLAFVEVDAPRGAVYLGAPFLITLRIGIEREALTRQLIQLFPQRLDVPVQVQAPWLADLPGAASAPSDALAMAVLPGGAAATLVLDGAVTKATVGPTIERNGKTFATVELTRAFVPTLPGTLHIPSSLLRFSWASRFQEDAIADPIPLDRQNGFVLGAARDLAIAPLPSAGRPADFGNAVGNFTIASSASPQELRVGQTVQLELTIAGQGNLAQLAPPALDQLPGLALQGRSERTEGRTRVIRYDLAVTATKVFAIPAIALPFFDPVAGTYRTAESQPIPLRIERDSAPAEPTPAPTSPRAHPAAGKTAQDLAPRWEASWPLGLGALILFGAAGMLLWRWLRSRR